MSAQSPSARAIARATKRPGRFPHSSMGILVWLTLVWVMLWGDFSTSRVVWGFLLALLVTTATPFPATPFDGRFRPLGVLILAIRLVADIFVSSFQQAGFILSGKRPKGAIIRVHLRSRSDAYLAIISTLTAIVPGSVVVEAHRASGTVYVHVFDEALAGGPDCVHRTILTLEERVMRAFASHEELVDAGYVPGSTCRAGRLPVPYAPASGEQADGLEWAPPTEDGHRDEGNADSGPSSIERTIVGTTA